jgi:hypothetical protein
MSNALGPIGEMNLLRRAEAAEFLRDRFGIRIAPTTLAKLACLGGGPRFRKFGRWPLYPEEELISWAERRLSGIVSSTSEVRSRG